MRSVRDAMDAAADPHRPVELYGDLAPVWAFVVARRYDYDALADAVAARAPGGATSLLVGGCGPGRLVARLADRFETVVGVDRSPTMCELARERTGARIVEADLLDHDPDREFDLVTLVGNTVIHLPAGRLPALFEAVRGLLAPGGRFCCDFTLASTLRNGHVTRDSFESDRYRVERTVVTTVTDRAPDASGVPARYTYSFGIEDRDRGDRVLTGTSTAVRLYEPAELLGAAIGAGFTGVATARLPTPHEGGLVARWPD